MQKLTIDLKREPEVAALVADMEPGDSVTLHTTIQAKDDQTLTLTLEQASEGEPMAEEEAGETGAGDDGGDTQGGDAGEPKIASDVLDQGGNASQ